MARINILLYILVINLIGQIVYSAEVIKAEPILNSGLLIKPQIVAPPSKPVQTVPSVNYVPKTNSVTNTVVPNSALNISAQNVSKTTVEGKTSKTGTVSVKPVANVSTSTEVSPVQPQQMDFKQCTKIFGADSERLFYIVIAAVNANNFKIDEIQSKSAYVLFSVKNKQFLLNVASIDKNNSIVKIVPANNNYYFPSGIVTNIFKYIDLNLSMPITKIN